MRRISHLGYSSAGLLLLLGVLTGCGGSTPAASTPPLTPTVTAATPASSPAPSPTYSATPSPSPDRTTAPVASASPTGANLDLSQYSLAGVLSPSGGIACLFAQDPNASVRCDVHDSQWHLQTPPQCHEAYGDSASVATGKAILDCHGDTVFGAPHQPTLPYGETVRFHDVTCTSATTGMTCRDAAGHGFTVSRTIHRLF